MPCPLRPALVGLSLVVLAALVPAAPPAARPFAALVDDYYSSVFAHDPGQATKAGFHDYDGRMPDMSSAAHVRRLAELKALQLRLRTLRGGDLTPDEMIDAELVDHAILAEQLEIETVRLWRSSPVPYLRYPADAIDGLVKRSFAPRADRLRSVVARLKGVPAILVAMRANVENPPKEYADLGAIVARGSLGFFKQTLPAWAAAAAGGDAALLAEFEAANRPVIDGYESAVTWVSEELMPKAKGNYAIGADAFLKKLEAEEMIDLPLDRLLAIGEANLKRDREAFVATAARIDPKAAPIDVLERINDDRPAPADLVAATRATVERTRQFLLDKRIASVPSEVRPTVEATPPYRRTGVFASMDTAGAYETKATEAFYYVTPPEADLEPARKDEFMKQFNRITMDNMTIHEAYPGHYLQYLYARQSPTKTRKLSWCGSNVEGWAHYTEQMAVEEGFGGGDPKVRLAQLGEALLRDCRYVVGIKLHTAGMTVEEGKRVFMEQGFIPGETAFLEARRGTYNPTYLFYTLGKLQIYKLREDVKKARGAGYSLQSFHDEFMRQGCIPVKLIRRLMLPGDTGPTL